LTRPTPGYTDEQKHTVTDDHLRFVVVAAVCSGLARVAFALEEV
jgi:hypothetical protein